MTKRLITVTTLLFALFAPGIAMAGVAQYVSGPAGTQVNGWYTQHPTITLRSYADCNPSQGNEFTVDVGGWSWSGGGKPPQAIDGRHYIKVMTDNDSTIFINNDGAYFSPTGNCPNASNTPTTVLWEGYLQWDVTPPSVSVTAPANNTNTASSSIQVSGSVADVGSGVQSVKVNGHAATVSAGHFTVQLPLAIGLNAITAVATDDAGHQTSSTQVLVSRNEGQGSAAGGKGNPPTEAGSKSQTGQSASSEPQPSASSVAPSSPNSKPQSAPIRTLVKGVSTPAGAGLTTVLGIIILLLVLDKFRVIEIKLFRHLYVRRLARTDASDHRKGE